MFKERIQINHIDDPTAKAEFIIEFGIDSRNNEWNGQYEVLDQYGNDISWMISQEYIENIEDQIRDIVYEYSKEQL